MSSGRGGTIVAAVMLVGLVADGCSITTTVRPERPQLGIANGTTLAVTLTVNGEKVAESKPGGPQPRIDVATLQPLPWEVEARSPSGRLLTSMHVDPGHVEITTDAGGVAAASGPFGRVDLSCGRLTIWAGGIQPSGPAPIGSPGSPGDCAP